MSAVRSLQEVLLQENLVQQEELGRAEQMQSSVGGAVGPILVRTGVISETDYLKALSIQTGFPLLGVREEDQPLPDGLAVYQFVKASHIQFDWFIDQSTVLWEMGEGTLGCLAKDGGSALVRDTLAYFYPDSQIQWSLCLNYDLEKILSFLRQERAVESLFEDGGAKHLKELAEEAPVIELVNNIISQAIETKASDIHIEPSETEFFVRLRVDGVLRTRLSQPMERFAAVASRIKLISGIDIAERRLPQDGRLSTRFGGVEMDIRVSTAPNIHGESIVLRLLPKERDDMSLSKLGMLPDHLQSMKQWAQEANGIILVTGPTGSGKSTTLYATLAEVDAAQHKVITVEDPVEYQMPGITQIQAHSDIGYTFATALRAILRQDPDVIMIGEIRDLETAEIAIQSALTGHLVLSTLHTNDAVSAFTRLIDMGIEPFLVAAPLKAVQAQRLVRKLCEHCAQPVSPPANVSDFIQQVNSDQISSQWRQAVGCAACQGTGYRGRSGIYEMVAVTTEMQKLIGRNAPVDEMRDLAKAQGSRTLLEDGLVKASMGLTSIDEVYRVVNH